MELENFVEETPGLKTGSKMVSYNQATGGFGHGFNSLYDVIEEEEISDDDIALDCDASDENCPTILLTKEDKRRLRSP